jgi:putative effector of murein hydrolase
MMLVGIVSGSVTCIIMVLVFAAIFRFDNVLLASLLPKSITSAIGVPLSEMAGGLASVTTAAIILSGIFASMMGTTFCKLYRLTDPVAQGVAFGTAGHVIATARASELSELIGAASSLSLVVAGLLTAAAFPLLMQFL